MENSDTKIVPANTGLCNLIAALAQFQSQAVNPPKNATNPHFRSKYADLASILDAVRRPLSEAGLAITQLVIEREKGPSLVTLLFHKSGESISSELALRAKGNDPQSIGSALTYARRYALQTILGLAAEDDDDGNGANGKATEKQQNRREQPRREEPKTEAPQQAPRITAEQIDAIKRRFENCLGGLSTILARKSEGRITAVEQLSEKSATRLLDNVGEYLAEAEKIALAQQEGPSLEELERAF